MLFSMFLNIPVGEEPSDAQIHERVFVGERLTAVPAMVICWSQRDFQNLMLAQSRDHLERCRKTAIHLHDGHALLDYVWGALRPRRIPILNDALVEKFHNS
mmetsp:Transcript_83621/g.159573  ORF Transcript_83621/g.159573 Transcript_83621/m.159573 type:complete len:101 (+) Transcript_83621:3-305(+)